MLTLPLSLQDGHLFIELDGELWLIDTGAPTSFGKSNLFSLGGKKFNLGATYQGLTPETLTSFVGVPCAGLLGTDVLGNFDHIFDTITGTLSISTSQFAHRGRTVALSEFMGIPVLDVQISGKPYRMFLDTGAQISYFQNASFADFPSAGSITDFYPGVGQFETDTRKIDVLLAGVGFTLRCGMLPSLLGATLMMAGIDGIIGNQILSHRIVGYFPRRRALVL